MTDKLPKVYCFITEVHSHAINWAVLTTDGFTLVGGTSSSVLWARRDCGYDSSILRGHGAINRAKYEERYPDGYDLEWVTRNEPHKGLEAALQAMDARVAEGRDD